MGNRSALLLDAGRDFVVRLRAHRDDPADCELNKGGLGSAVASVPREHALRLQVIDRAQDLTLAQPRAEELAVAATGRPGRVRVVLATQLGVVHAGQNRLAGGGGPYPRGEDS
jgi:hypothetical protein